MTDNNVYTQEEQDILNLTQNKRLSIVSEMTKEIPTKVGEVRVVNELLNSIDSAVQEAAKTRIKAKEAQNNKATASIVASALIELGRKRSALQPAIAANREINNDFIPVDVVDGELEIHPVQLSIEDFIDPEEL